MLEKIENGSAVLDFVQPVEENQVVYRQWEFVSSDVKINRKTQQFIADDLLQFHWMLIKVFTRKDLHEGLLSLLLGK